MIIIGRRHVLKILSLIKVECDYNREKTCVENLKSRVSFEKKKLGGEGAVVATACGSARS